MTNNHSRHELCKLASYWVVMCALGVNAVVVVARVAFSLVTADVARAPENPSIVILFLSGLVGLAFLVLAGWLLSRGAAVAPYVVSAVGVWSATDLYWHPDLLAWATLLIVVVMVIAVWLPSSRLYARRVREDRSAKRSGGQARV